ncbi:hypothetical protein CHS0354_032482 [Potamilus streckersoni]|uniref:Uncharacterized protein n=1 Tax=Potamilus streckersoni TaxID=2493646 RepID=A0AAE0W0H4_9BIVA|nr:hypothetical protein CHS0354_032482 [Potamilus streckersoni]
MNEIAMDTLDSVASNGYLHPRDSYSHPTEGYLQVKGNSISASPSPTHPSAEGYLHAKVAPDTTIVAATPATAGKPTRLDLDSLENALCQKYELLKIYLSIQGSAIP